MVGRPKGNLRPGTLVTVVTREGSFVGRGIYNPQSNIAVRLLTELENEHLDAGFFLGRLRAAKALREEVLQIHAVADCYRLVHGESDGLSGLIIDKFADLLVIEPYSAGYLPAMNWIVDALTELFPAHRIGLRPDAKQMEREGASREAGEWARRLSTPDAVTIREYDMRMKIDFRVGHKTGYFLDQRENRRRISELSRGRHVLDLFCYTGGFSVAALKGGASSVTAVDLDEKALATALENARTNHVRIEFAHRDVFDFLRSMVEKKEQADVVIVDPSKLAGVRDEISVAKRKYGDLNRLAMKAVRPGGVLFTSSCSGLISEPDFLSILTRSAAEAGIIFQAFSVTGASGDHPFSSIFPEGRYLKAVFARILPGNGRRIVSEEKRDRRDPATMSPMAPKE